jgi:hypothetical protein
MTVAVCLVCGGQKLGSFNPCGRCAWSPNGDEDRIRSMMLSDHYHPVAQLEEWGQAMRRGTELELPEHVVARLLAESAGVLDHVRRTTALRRAPEGSPARQLQDELGPLLERLESSASSRRRFLHVAGHGAPPEDADQAAAFELALRLQSASDETCADWLVRLLCLAYAPFVSVAALEALGGPPAMADRAERASKSVLTLRREEQGRALAALGCLVKVVQSELPLLHEAHRRLDEALR